MPRLTTDRYLQIHHYLKNLWLTDPDQFPLVKFKEQQALHQYFQTTRDVSDPLLIKTRTQLTNYEPSLPHRAGRALAHLERAIERASSPKPEPVARPHFKQAERIISIRSLANPEPDAQKIALALLSMAKTMAKANSVIDAREHESSHPPEPALFEPSSDHNQAA